MADLRLITILPGQTVQGVPSSQGSPGAPSHAGNLVSLPPGTVLSGFIINRDAAGNPVLRTDRGDITFSSPFFLRIGSEVVIRIESHASGTLAHILSVNGQPPEVAAAQSSFAQEPEVILSQHLAPQPPRAAPAAIATTPRPVPSAVTLAASPLTVTGTLIAAPPPPAGAPVVPPTGTQVTLTVLQVIPPPSNVPDELLLAAAPPLPPDPKTSASPAHYSAYAKATGVPLSPVTASPTPSTAVTAPPLPAGTTPSIPTAPTMPVSIIPAAAPPAAIPSASVVRPSVTASATPPPVLLQPGQTVTATVIAHEPTGESLVETPAGVLRLPPQAAPAIGSRISLQIIQLIPPNASTDNAAPAPVTELTRHWASLQDILGLLREHTAESRLNFVHPAMPWLSPPSGLPNNTAPQNMPVGLMLFISALRGGDFRNWLGERHVQWLEATGHEALVRKASAEFMTLSRQFAEPPAQQWQTLFFPVAVGGELHQVRLFVKRDRERSSQQRDKKSEDTRFVIEMELTQLGEMQMDGFVRKRPEALEFDLVVRSLTRLPDEVQRDILRIYNDAGEITGYRGSLTFQAVREFPVRPMEEVMTHMLGKVTV